MTTLQLLIVCLTIIVVAAIWRFPGMINFGQTSTGSLVGKTVVINTSKPDDQTIRGVVHAFDPELVTLREAVYIGRGGTHAVAGTLTVLRANVSTIQGIDPEKVAA